MSTCEEMTIFKIRCCRKRMKCIQTLVVHVQVGSNHSCTLSFSFYDSFTLSFNSFFLSLTLSLVLSYYLNSTLQHFASLRDKLYSV